MARTAGGPLLCVRDLIQDLSQEPVSEFLDSALYETTPKDSASSSSEMGSENQSLQSVFERTYTELNDALMRKGHSWTALTQQLYAALTTADKMVVSIHRDLASTMERVGALENIMQRGNAAIDKLESALRSNQEILLSISNLPK
eukprot:c18217_g1_i1 orf=135-569(+)